MKTNSSNVALVKRFLIGGFLEFGPVIAFLLSFQNVHIYRATLILMMTTIISTVLTYKIQKRLPYLALYVAFLTVTFGYITIALHQPKFIQMKDTLYDLTCALTIIVGYIFNFSVLKFAFHSVLPMSKRSWDKLTYIWAVFFLLVAGMNEYIRTTKSLHDWFDYKTTILFVTCLFGFASVYYAYEKAEVKN